MSALRDQPIQGLQLGLVPAVFLVLVGRREPLQRDEQAHDRFLVHLATAADAVMRKPVTK